MLDKFLVIRNTPHDVFADGYTPEQSITDRRLINERAQNLHVLFPPWHGGGQAYERLINRLSNSGDAVLAYYFNSDILRPDADMVHASYTYIRDQVAAELHEVVGNHDFKHVNLLAMSLGNTALSAVTSKFQAFDSAVLVCTASSLARSLWHGIRTQHIRTVIEQAGHDLPSLEKAWHDLAAISHLDALKGKDIRVIASTTDKIIPAPLQMELVEAARGNGIDPKVEMTRLGHYAAIGKFCMYDDGRACA